jgi:hypothetical protein
VIGVQFVTQTPRLLTLDPETVNDTRNGPTPTSAGRLRPLRPARRRVVLSTPMAHPLSPPQPPVKLSLGENLLLLVWAMITQGLAFVVAPRVVLVYRYGLTRVVHDHLHFLAMPKHQPWLVSNGDTISNVQFICFLIGIVCWFALVFATYPLVRLVVPWRSKSGTGLTLSR